MTQDTELKPCAHCGSDSRLICNNSLENEAYWIACNNNQCRIQQGGLFNKKESIDKWNKRNLK